MKKQLLTIATLACFTFAGASVVAAKTGQHENPMRSLIKLNLSDEQKQDMQAIFKATRENNSVYAGEKKEIMTQMNDLMRMPSWDQTSAEAIIRSQLQQSESISLNRAKARHQVYNLLSDEQKAKLAEKTGDKTENAQRKSAKIGDAKKRDKSKGERKGKGKGRKIKLARLTKALSLSDTQIGQFKAIDSDAKQQMLGIKEQSEAHREMMKAIVHASSFDEGAWLAAHSNTLDHKVAVKLIKTKVHYDRANLLNDEQKLKFAKIMKKMKDKLTKTGFIE